jgi:hypothetical protein
MQLVARMAHRHASEVFTESVAAAGAALLLALALDSLAIRAAQAVAALVATLALVALQLQGKETLEALALQARVPALVVEAAQRQWALTLLVLAELVALGQRPLLPERLHQVPMSLEVMR